MTSRRSRRVVVITIRMTSDGITITVEEPP